MSASRVALPLLAVIGLVACAPSKDSKDESDAPSPFGYEFAKTKRMTGGQGQTD